MMCRKHNIMKWYPYWKIQCTYDQREVTLAHSINKLGPCIKNWISKCKQQPCKNIILHTYFDFKLENQ